MIGNDDMKNLLELSRLRLEPEELAELQIQLGDILNYFALLNQYETDDVNMDLGESIEIASLRQDSSAAGIERDKITDFAAEFEEGYFIVPRILDEGEDG